MIMVFSLSQILSILLGRGVEMMSYESQAGPAQSDFELLIFWPPSLKCWIAVVWFSSLFETEFHVTQTGPLPPDLELQA